MKDSSLENQIFYLVEKANKVARRYSQEVLYKNGFDITIDQWLALKKIYDNDNINQNELASALFKDKASITRILDILIERKLVKKQQADDKRILELTLTATGKEYTRKALQYVRQIRQTGVSGISEKDLATLRSSLEKMINNLSL